MINTENPKQTPSVKKGNSSWKPASAMEVINKEPGFRYRWSNKMPDNLAKKEVEGWETVSGVQSDQSVHLDAGRMNDGKQMTSIRERHDVILQRIPEETAQGRDAYMNQKTEMRTNALTAHIKKAAKEDGTQTHGEITITSMSGEKIIK